MQDSDDKRAEDARIAKFYIMAMAATGKSTFARNHPHYRGYRVIDFADELPQRSLFTSALLYVSRFNTRLRNWLRNRGAEAGRFKHAYFEKAFARLDGSDEPMALLGRRTRSNYRELPYHDRMRFAMVLIPEEQHRKQVESRKSSMRNFLPFLDHWTTNFDNIVKIRQEMQDYAEQFDIPVYESIDAAIDAMHKAYGGEATED